MKVTLTEMHSIRDAIRTMYMSKMNMEWRDRAAAQRNGRSLHRSLWEAIRSARG